MGSHRRGLSTNCVTLPWKQTDGIAPVVGTLVPDRIMVHSPWLLRGGENLLCAQHWGALLASVGFGPLTTFQGQALDPFLQMSKMSCRS